MWLGRPHPTEGDLGNPRCSCQQTPRGLETRCGREGYTRPRGPSESPDGVDPNIRRTIKTQRDGHNSGIKIWSLRSVSASSHMQTLKQPFQTLAIKWEVNIIEKKSSASLSCVFLDASFIIVSVFTQYIYMRISAWISRWQLYVFPYTYWLQNGIHRVKSLIRMTPQCNVQYHHHAVLIAQISLTLSLSLSLSRYSSQSFIATGWSSWLYFMSKQNCCI